MEKQEILSLIQRELAAGIISRVEILNLVNANTVSDLSETNFPKEKSTDLVSIFYAIGAIIVLSGVGVLVGQYWEDIGFLGRISVSLGVSLVTYIAALVFQSPEQRTLSQVFFTISAVLAPLGSFVLLEEANINITWAVQASIASVLFIIFGTAFLISRKNILLLIIVGQVSWAYYAFLFKIFDFNSFWDTGEILKWASILLGVSYILIAYSYQMTSRAIDTSDQKQKAAVGGVLYALGTWGVLFPGIFIGGIFDLVYILFIFAAFYGSIYLKSRAMLIFGALFLMAHIVKLTYKYFVDSMGWPLALILIGFVIIGVGYLTYSLNKKYISSPR